MSPTAATCSFNISYSCILQARSTSWEMEGVQAGTAVLNMDIGVVEMLIVSELRDKQKDKVIDGKSRNYVGSFSSAYLGTCLLTSEEAGVEGGETGFVYTQI